METSRRRFFWGRAIVMGLLVWTALMLGKPVLAAADLDCAAELTDQNPQLIFACELAEVGTIRILDSTQPLPIEPCLASPVEKLVCWRKDEFVGEKRGRFTVCAVLRVQFSHREEVS